MDIRNIETIIDKAHEHNVVFESGKKQTTYDLLASFEDMCGAIFMSSVLNPFALGKIVDQMDALNMALIWSSQLCPNDQDELLVTELSEKRYEQCCILLNEYAYPYSVICSGYIAYSRDRFKATVNDNCVTFDFNGEQNKSAWSDILREKSAIPLDEMARIINPYELMQASAKLKEQITIQDGAICYSLTAGVMDTFKTIAQQQWEITKTLPDDWKFDLFTLAEYKDFWIAITALCYIHFCSCFSIQDPAIRLRNSTIIQRNSCIVDYVVAETGLDKSKVETMIEYITYNPQKKNVDIMYQPIVQIEKDMLILAPILFMGSRPERNLLAVVSTMHDSEYSKEVNDLEGLMIAELESFVNSPDIVKHRHLRDDLPDIDFAILDKTTCSAMICETKWFAAADSAKEVYAKEDDITHGCQQVESIMAYAMSDRKQFFKRVFGIDDGDTIDLFGCVIAKHNIRTQHKYIPVIDLKRIEELLSSYSLNSVFHLIRNHEYEIELPEDAILTHQDIDYAGFKFKIPAICFGAETEL